MSIILSRGITSQNVAIAKSKKPRFRSKHLVARMCYGAAKDVKV